MTSIHSFLLLLLIPVSGCITQQSGFEKSRSYSLDEVNIRDGRVFHGKRLIRKGQLLGSYSANEGIRLFLKAAIERGLISSAETRPPGKSDWWDTAREWNGLIITAYNSEGGVLTEIEVSQGKLGRKTKYTESSKADELPTTKQEMPGQEYEPAVLTEIEVNEEKVGKTQEELSGREYEPPVLAKIEVKQGNLGQKTTFGAGRITEELPATKQELSGQECTMPEQLARSNGNEYDQILKSVNSDDNNEHLTRMPKQVVHQKANLGERDEQAEEESDSEGSSMCCLILGAFFLFALLKN